jgi:hypothetical protein
VAVNHTVTFLVIRKRGEYSLRVVRRGINVYTLWTDISDKFADSH